jgi:hypothetical protein
MILLLAAGYGIACYKWGAWRQWREYYATILYVIIGDLAYQFVFCDYRLWMYTGILGNCFTSLIITFIVFPPAVILYLSHYPAGFLKQALYILAWTVGNTMIEAIALVTHGLRYDHQWSLIWSFLLFLIAFILIRAHYKKPLVVWPISLACGIVCCFLFRIPCFS